MRRLLTLYWYMFCTAVLTYCHTNEKSRLRLGELKKDHLINIEIHITFQSHDYIKILTNQQDLDNLTDIVKLANENIELLIYSPELHPIKLQLTKSYMILSDEFVVMYSNSTDHSMEEHSNIGYELEHCYFNGKIINHSSSLVTLKLCNGISGTLETDKQVTSINTDVLNSHVTFTLSQSRDFDENRDYAEKMNCGAKNSAQSDFPQASRKERQSEDNFARPERYIEMFIVFDTSMFERLNRSISNCVDRVLQLTHYAARYYREFNVYLALRGVEVWTFHDAIRFPKISKTGDLYDSDAIVTQFNYYRIGKGHIGNSDLSVLVTNRTLSDNIAGLASLNGACSLNSAGVLIVDSVKSILVSAGVLAHEIAHTLGVSHTSENAGRSCSSSCSSSATACLMSPNLSK